MNVSPAMQAALDRIEGVHNARALRYLIRARTERRNLVNSFMAPECYGALMRWLSEPSPYVGGFMTTQEARKWLAKEIARIMSMRRLRGADYYGFRDNAHRLPGLRDRLIVATYFDRFGAELWAREAA